MYFNSTNPFQNQTSGVGDYLNNLLKTWNISPLQGILIGCGILVGVLITLVLIIYRIRKSMQTENKKSMRILTNKNLYQEDSSSEIDSPHGYLDMTLKYNTRKREVVIHEIAVCKMFIPSASRKPDCYIIIYVKRASGKHYSTQRTKTVVNDLNPNFNEDLIFKIRNIKKDYLYFQLFDENLTGNDIVLREGELILTELTNKKYEKFQNSIVLFKLPLKPKSLGDVAVILWGNRPLLKITILEAKELKIEDSGSPNQAYNVHVEVKVFVDKHLKKHFRTKSSNNICNPYFHETFQMKIFPDLWDKVCIKIELFRSRFRRIGKIYIGNEAVNSKINELGQWHWDMICKEDKSSKAIWHAIL